jgi:hypothetical protein
MKKLTTTIFAALIGLALTVPAMAQNANPAPKTTTQSKDDSTKKSTTKKNSKKKSSKKGSDTSSDKSAPAPAKK